MSWAGVNYRELRFVIEDELTQVYVFCEALGDCPIGVQGWHHKTFPKTKTTMQILSLMFEGGDYPILWAQQAPPVAVVSPGLVKRVGEEARAIAAEASSPRTNQAPAEVPPEFRAAIPCRPCGAWGMVDEDPVSGLIKPCAICGGEGAVYVDVRRLRPWRTS